MIETTRAGLVGQIRHPPPGRHIQGIDLLKMPILLDSSGGMSSI